MFGLRTKSNRTLGVQSGSKNEIKIALNIQTEPNYYKIVWFEVYIVSRVQDTAYCL